MHGWMPIFSACHEGTLAHICPTIMISSNCGRTALLSLSQCTTSLTSQKSTEVHRCSLRMKGGVPSKHSGSGAVEGAGVGGARAGGDAWHDARALGQCQGVHAWVGPQEETLQPTHKRPN